MSGQRDGGGLLAYGMGVRYQLFGCCQPLLEALPSRNIFAPTCAASSMSREMGERGGSLAIGKREEGRAHLLSIPALQQTDQSWQQSVIDKSMLSAKVYLLPKFN
jgi:hypothetical protein